MSWKSQMRRFEIQVEPRFFLTIGSCFSLHFRVMEHAGSLENTEEA